jgi:hypothetical protein
MHPKASRRVLKNVAGGPVNWPDLKFQRATVLSCISFLPASQHGSDYTRIAASVEYRYDPQRLLLRRISDHIFTHQFEPKWARSEVWPSIPLMWKRHEKLNSMQNIFGRLVRGIEVISRDVLPNLVKVNRGFGMKTIPDQEIPARRESLFARKRAFTSSPLMSFTLPLSRS